MPIIGDPEYIVFNFLPLMSYIHKSKTAFSGFSIFIVVRELKGLGNTSGETEVKIVINKSHKIVKLHLKNKRKIDNNLLNSLNLLENVAKE